MIKLPLFFTTLFLLIAGVSNAQTTAVSNDEALRLGHWVETTTNSGKTDAIDNILDLDVMLEKMSGQSKVLANKAFRDGFREGFSKSMKGYGQKILVSTKNGNYRLIRAYAKDGQQHLLFRMFGDGGLNYHDYTLIKIKDSVKASDCYVYTTDEELTRTMSKLVDIMSANMNQTELPEDIKSISKLSQLRNQGDYAGARTYYEKLDPRLKQNKAIQVIYISICQHIDQTLYRQELEHYSALYPNAGSGYLMMVDMYYLQKGYARGIVAVNKLDSLLGKDPFLDFYRGIFYGLSGEKEKSISCYEKVYKYDPSLRSNTEALIVAYASNKQNDKAKAVISEYKKTAAFHQEDLDKMYAKFPDLK
jgi:tetratricopeptide (TPR) repeat protein